MYELHVESVSFCTSPLKADVYCNALLLGIRVHNHVCVCVCVHMILKYFGDIFLPGSSGHLSCISVPSSLWWSKNVHTSAV